ncbi:MAG TPA: hypothetical protein VFL27_04020 [Candidatus Dormibacteraeota bacterium]|nr:hypothetical protein [Candidatus Dormibacteraeota bacterium]
MTDTTGAFPPPPPASIPPPVYGAPPPPPPSVQLPPGYRLPPGYQGPAAPDYAAPYQQVQQQPWAQYPQAINPGAVAFGGASAILYQFGGPAAYAVIVGVLGIALPLFAGYYFRVLPIFGILAGVRAIMGGRVLGGGVGIGVNVLAGLLSLVSAGLIG